MFFLSHLLKLLQSDAAKINHKVLCDEKQQQLTTEVYVQRTERQFLTDYPAGAPERAMSLIALITRVPY